MSGTLLAVPLTKRSFAPFGDIMEADGFLVVDRKGPGNNREEIWFGEREISYLALI